MRKLFLIGCLFIFVSVLFSQTSVFNDMDEDPYWGGQRDLYEEPETHVYLSYVSDPVLFDEGAMMLEWGVTHNQSEGGSSYIGHKNLDTLGVYDWSAYDSIIVWYYNESPSSMPGDVQLRFNLGDVSDAENGANTYDFGDMEYWYSFHYILDDPTGWNRIALPLADADVDPNGFDRLDSHGIEGNDQLDLDMIKGFQFEFSIEASEGDVAMGIIFLDHMILTTTGGDTSIFFDMDADPYWGGQRDLYEEPESNVYLSYVSEPVLFGEGAMKLEWGATHDQSWGGGAYLGTKNLDTLGVYDWSEFDTVAFWYYNDSPSSIPGAVHLRFNLGDVSDSDNGANTYDFGDMEYWYSFHYILDDPTGWNRIALPLVDVREDPLGNGFERLGWHGIDGNDELDLDMIKGFQFEFSIAATEGDIAYGTIVLDHMVVYSGEFTDVQEIPLQRPINFQLSQNYPNPFNASTVIDYSLSKESLVRLKLFDAMGREVRTLVNQRKPAGNYHAHFNAADLSSGVYFYQVQTDDYSQMRKMILIK